MYVLGDGVADSTNFILNQYKIRTKYKFTSKKSQSSTLVVVLFAIV